MHPQLFLRRLLIASCLFFSLANCCCKAQQVQSVQIVAQAALCFNNQTVTSRCVRWMQNGIASLNATNRFCNSACYGQMMISLDCAEAVFSNFRSYGPGMMKGVQSIFNMSCGGRRFSTSSSSSTGSKPNTTISTGSKPNTTIRGGGSASGNMLAEPITSKAHAKHSAPSTCIVLLAALLGLL